MRTGLRTSWDPEGGKERWEEPRPLFIWLKPRHQTLGLLKFKIETKNFSYCRRLLNWGFLLLMAQRTPCDLLLISWLFLSRWSYVDTRAKTAMSGRSFKDRRDRDTASRADKREVDVEIPPCASRASRAPNTHHGQQWRRNKWMKNAVATLGRSGCSYNRELFWPHKTLS